jgi:cellulose synthase/poly-beta-1,6-N-acetylglucosamine synthase-like glycosyltransferase
MSLFFQILGWSLAGLIVLFLVQAILIWLISLFVKYPKRPENSYLHPFTVVITAYKNIVMCNPLVESLLRSNYPNLDIILIADECDTADFYIKEKNIKVLVPERPLGSKVRSLAYAIDHIDKNSEGVVVMDPDNLAHPDFLYNINDYFHKGYEVVQGIRIAKNKNSSIAKSDSLGESYYNFTDRYLTFKIGSSATIAGSGMAIKKKLFIDFLTSNEVKRKLDNGPILGEDKMLQNFTVFQGGRIAFEPRAIIFDEKLVHGRQVERQRTRWINTYFDNINDSVKMIINGLTKLSWNAFWLGMVSLKPPLIILVGVTILVAVLSFLIDPRISILLLGGLILFALFFLYASWRSPHTTNVSGSILGLPKFIFHQLKALIKTRKHRKDFLTTQNSQNISIEDLMNKERS